MFGDLPKIFDRWFVIAFILPAFIFVIGWREGAVFFGLPIPAIAGKLTKAELLTMIALITWIIALILSVLNHEIIRFFEGYHCYEHEDTLRGIWNPMTWSRGEKKRFKALCDEREELERLRNQLPRDEYSAPAMAKRRRRVHTLLTSYFPDTDDCVLPTSFGNILRSFEVYSRIMYGAEAITTWPRLVAVLPSDYRGFIDASKAQVDFWLNSLVLGSVSLVALIALMINTGRWAATNLALLLILLIILCNWRAKRSAVVWGDWIRSSFDVYLPDLAAKIGLPPTEDPDERKRQWVAFGRATTFCRPEFLPKADIETKPPELQHRVRARQRRYRKEQAGEIRLPKRKARVKPEK